MNIRHKLKQAHKRQDPPPHSQMCVVLKYSLKRFFIAFEMGNLSVLSLLWFHDTKEKSVVKKREEAGELRAFRAPKWVRRTDLASAEEESRHLEMGQREIRAPRGS